MFVTLSNTAVNDLLGLGIKKQNIIRILPGVDHNILKPSKKSEVPLLIYFGGMRDYKRPWMALELLNALKAKNFTLIVVGSGQSFLRVKEFCKKYSLHSQVKFTGRVSYDELVKLLGSSWINLHFSLTEGFGLSIVEAAACGTPTVALDAPGVSEVINEFGLGLVARDVGDMKNKIEEILEDYDMWSRRVYENSFKFSWDKTAEEWNKLFKSLA
jgi:glycosyltransferase involved in cell wall biosynthesis